MRDINLSAEDRRRIAGALAQAAANFESFGMTAEAEANRELAKAVAPFECVCGKGVLFEDSDCGKVSCQINRIAKSDLDAAADFAAAVNAEVI